MTPLTLFASVSTAAALGAAGWAVFTEAPAGSQPQPSVLATPAKAAEVGPVPSRSVDSTVALPAASSDEPSSPRECRAEEGIDRDCTFE